MSTLLVAVVWYAIDMIKTRTQGCMQLADIVGVFHPFVPRGISSEYCHQYSLCYSSWSYTPLQNFCSNHAQVSSWQATAARVSGPQPVHPQRFPDSPTQV